MRALSPKIRIAFVLIGFSFVFTLFFCSPSTSYENGTDFSELEKLMALTPRADREAEEAAIWLSGELLAPESLYQQLLRDFELLRSQHGAIVDTLEFWNEKLGSRIEMKVSGEVKAAIRDGSYHAWDDLNELFNVIEMDTGSFRLNREYGLLYLEFEGRLNPFRLQEYYDTLPGISAYGSPITFSGDGPVLIPWIIDGETAFLWRNAWGDCPSGCIYSHFIYFRQEDGIFMKVGEFRSRKDDFPLWWDEIKCAYYAFWHSVRAECN